MLITAEMVGSWWMREHIEHWDCPLNYVCELLGDGKTPIEVANMNPVANHSWPKYKGGLSVRVGL